MAASDVKFQPFIMPTPRYSRELIGLSIYWGIRLAIVERERFYCDRLLEIQCSLDELVSCALCDMERWRNRDNNFGNPNFHVFCILHF